jgi:hypothetical protein
VLMEVRERDAKINFGRAHITFDNKGEPRLG